MDEHKSCKSCAGDDGDKVAPPAPAPRVIVPGRHGGDGASRGAVIEASPTSRLITRANVATLQPSNEAYRNGVLLTNGDDSRLFAGGGSGGGTDPLATISRRDSSVPMLAMNVPSEIVQESATCCCCPVKMEARIRQLPSGGEHIGHEIELRLHYKMQGKGTTSQRVPCGLRWIELIEHNGPKEPPTQPTTIELQSRSGERVRPSVELPIGQPFDVIGDNFLGTGRLVHTGAMFQSGPIAQGKMLYECPNGSGVLIVRDMPRVRATPGANIRFPFVRRLNIEVIYAPSGTPCANSCKVLFFSFRQVIRIAANGRVEEVSSDPRSEERDEFTSRDPSNIEPNGVGSVNGRIWNSYNFAP